MNSRAGRFPLMDSLRALAALSVFVYHVSFFAGDLPSRLGFLAPFIAKLNLGVPIFFLISGFLLYRPFVAARLRGENRPLTGPYAWRRFLRIVPGYWVALTATTLVLGTSGVLTASGILTYYGYGQIYQPETAFGGISQAWTLCVEVTFYAFLPLYAAAMARVPLVTPRARAGAELVGLAGLATTALVWMSVVVPRVDITSLDAQPWIMALPNYLDQFALGMALALASVWWRHLPRGLRVIDRFPSVAWLCAFGAYFVATRLPEPERMNASDFVAQHVLFAVVAVFVLLPAVFGEPSRGLLRRVLANRALAWLGLTSYGVYLYHVFVLEELRHWNLDSLILGNPYVTWTSFGLAGSVLLAGASYYVVERPALRLKGLWTERREPAEDEGAASVPALPELAVSGAFESSDAQGRG